MREIILKYSALFDQSADLKTADETINTAVKQWPEHTEIKEVYLINSIYSTKVFGIYSLAKHITTIPDLSTLIKNGDVEAVTAIQHGHKIKSKIKEIDFLSFATKYCSFHNPASFPIFDNFIEKYLYKMAKKRNWFPKITHKKMRDYDFFRNVIDKFRKEFNLTNESYKTIDKGLWLYVREQNKK